MPVCSIFSFLMPVVYAVIQDLNISHANYKSSSCFRCSRSDPRSDVFKDVGIIIIMKMYALKPKIQTGFCLNISGLF